MMFDPAVAVLVFVTVQRIGELLLARRNTRALLARGACETGASHYPYVVALHAIWLAGLWLLAPGRPVSLGWCLIFVALQLLRVWVLATLKRRWTTRIIVLARRAARPIRPLSFHAPPELCDCHRRDRRPAASIRAAALRPRLFAA